MMGDKEKITIRNLKIKEEEKVTKITRRNKRKIRVKGETDKRTGGKIGSRY